MDVRYIANGLTLGAIMKSLLTLSFLLSLIVCTGQSSFYQRNDSVVTKLYNHFSSCQTLASSRQFNETILRIDRSVVNMSNDLYNNVFTKKQLQDLSKKYSETIYGQTLYTKEVGDTEKIFFTPYFNGNLIIFYHADIVKDSIVSFEMGFSTNSKVDCNTSGNIVHYFDFLYINKYFLKNIDFPLFVEPWTADVIISRQFKH
jgi:hypothetical protein